MYLSVTRPELWRGIHPECSRSCSGEGIFGLPNYRFGGIQRQGAQGRSGRQHDVAVRDVRSADPLLRP